MRIKDRPEFSNKPRPLSLPAETTVADAVARMSAKNYGSVIVDDGNGGVGGIVTERDVMIRLVNEGRDARTTTLADIMTKEIRVARADDSVVEWLRAMSNERFRRVPVVDENGKLVSMMTQGDFVSYTWPDLMYQVGQATKATLSENRQLVIIAAAIGIYTIVLIALLAAVF